MKKLLFLLILIASTFPKVSADYLRDEMIIYKSDGSTINVPIEHIQRILFESVATDTKYAVAEPIDLGLSVKWASWNIGATSPLEYGGYYGWGDPTGEKDSDNMEDYPSANPPLNICGTEYDIAKASWGDKWRLPSFDELYELYTKCTWTLYDEYIHITGPSGNSIDIPYAGSIWGREKLDGYALWSGSLNNTFLNDNLALSLFDTHPKTSTSIRSSLGRNIKCSIRPVYGDYNPVEITMTIGDYMNLSTPTVALFTYDISIKNTVFDYYIYLFYSKNADEIGGDKMCKFIKLCKIEPTQSEHTSFDVIKDLEPGTTYYCRLYASSDYHCHLGEIKSFTTPAIEPVVTVTTGNASSVTENNATVSATFSVSNVTGDYMTGITYGTTSSAVSGGSGTFVEIGKNLTSGSKTLSGLSPSTTYYYCAYVKYDDKYYYGDVKSFKTQAIEPVVTITYGNVTNVTGYSATVSATFSVSNMTGDYMTGITYGTTYSEVSGGNGIFVEIGKNTTSGSKTLTELSPSTSYFYRAYVKYNDKYYYGAMGTFATTASITGTNAGYAYVDLGLPSGLLWAIYNVGASSITDYGDYYAWGMTTTEYTNLFKYDSWNTYTYYNVSSNSCSSLGNISGTRYDVARAKWGSTWRMPTQSEMQELIDNCTWKITTKSDKTLWEVTGPNGMKIYFPLAGYYNSQKYYQERYGFYWTSTELYDYEYLFAAMLYLSESSVKIEKNVDHQNPSNNVKYHGLTVRPVTSYK